VIADAARPMPHTPRSLALWKAGRGKPVEVIRPEAPPIAARLIDEVFDALDEQTVVVRASAPAFAALHDPAYRSTTDSGPAAKPTPRPSSA
jgi:hypothetical protein